MLAAVLDERPPDRLAGHFHDTGGRALDNIEAAMARGLRVFDASAGGLGGCPYAPGASGNVATEDLVDLFEREGVRTGIDLDALVDACDWLERDVLARRLPGRSKSSSVRRLAAALPGVPRSAPPSKRWKSPAPCRCRSCSW